MIFAPNYALTDSNRTSAGVRVLDAHTSLGQVPQACLTLAASPGM
ncbi:MAG: hypothetical protein QOK07_628 [Gemmatimonadaceae bacterium]|nr:hypothetical protein [Gemmatimonadaceae bacterium]